jgi:hypothetical protein
LRRGHRKRWELRPLSAARASAAASSDGHRCEARGGGVGNSANRGGADARERRRLCKPIAPPAYPRKSSGGGKWSQRELEKKVRVKNVGTCHPLVYLFRWHPTDVDAHSAPTQRVHPIPRMTCVTPHPVVPRAAPGSARGPGRRRHDGLASKRGGRHRLDINPIRARMVVRAAATDATPSRRDILQRSLLTAGGASLSSLVLPSPATAEELFCGYYSANASVLPAWAFKTPWSEGAVDVSKAVGRGLHSSTSQLNLSRV